VSTKWGEPHTGAIALAGVEPRGFASHAQRVYHIEGELAESDGAGWQRSVGRHQFLSSARGWAGAESFIRGLPSSRAALHPCSLTPAECPSHLDRTAHMFYTTNTSGSLADSDIVSQKDSSSGSGSTAP